MYLRELPEPLFKFSLEDRVQHTVEFGQNSLHLVPNRSVLTEFLSQKNTSLQISNSFVRRFGVSHQSIDIP